jgi:2-C-methyl-D-erythritol 4-phosphate cytidylyltransferase
MAVALLVAAGRGERLGASRPKALVPLGGRPMLEWSLETLRALPSVQSIAVALPAGGELGAARDGVLAVRGGPTRSDSVRLALRAVGPGDPVIVHDAARPLAAAELFQRALAELERAGVDAVVAAVPVGDTIKEVADDERTVTRTLDRRRLWAAQTPQVFRREVLERVMAECSDESLAHATDDAWLIEQAGGSVAVLQADAQNIKVTTEFDLRLAEVLLSERQA